jgi:hypothetical protein
MKELVKTYCKEDWITFEKAMKDKDVDMNGGEEEEEEEEEEMEEE